MALATLLAHLAAGRFAGVLALTSGGAPTASAAHRVLHLLLRTSPPPPLLPRLVALARWSRAHFRAPLPLRLHALLLARLASDGGLHSLLRSELHALAAGASTRPRPSSAPSPLRPARSSPTCSSSRSPGPPSRWPPTMHFSSRAPTTRATALRPSP
ncbi:unnamed protein product [Miscanthus lutarioriparius]|uniref:Uncharacterized protein n=1 Tax=Miscanthus lutarioriparius TaxID=422564 RepID=A0A811SGK7_9POAL|nr:unnamed protein product [Miscanthus lutarioriparius]